MKKLILIISLLVPTTAFADGCWVNYNNPGFCSNEFLVCTFDLDVDLFLYGPQIADACFTIDALAKNSDEWQASSAAWEDYAKQLEITSSAWKATAEKLDRINRRLKKKIRRLKKGRR